MDVNRYYSSFILPGTAIFALLWAVARACVQSITIDEADTYLVWVARRDPAHWQAASNNHVLNSLLMRLFTSVFPVSQLSVRAPALLGAALYILAAYFLCRKLTPELPTQWPLFVCLVYNPFVFDHLVAARGYALALGFLMCILRWASARGWMRRPVPCAPSARPFPSPPIFPSRSSTRSSCWRFSFAPAPVRRHSRRLRICGLVRAARAAGVDFPERSRGASLAGRRTELRRAFAG